MLTATRRLLISPRLLTIRDSSARLSSTDTTPAALAQRLGKDRASLDEFIDALPAAERKRASLRYVATELEDEFGRADLNRDGSLTFSEFKAWAAELISEGKRRGAIKSPPTSSQLRALFFQTGTPYIGFGLVDNAMMVLSGEAIDNTIGFMLGLSVLGAAALGNAFSNGLGMVLHGTLERYAERIGLPDPRLTIYQRGLPVVHTVRTVAGISGVVLGCVLGMFPLLFMNASTSHDNKYEEKSK